MNSLQFYYFEFFSILGCLSGYFGQSCIFACRYPNYGKDCQSECLCDEEICNHITGCEQKSNAYVKCL